MLYRRLIFTLSLLIAVALYAALLWLAPQVSMLRARDRSADIVARFRVQMRAPQPEHAAPKAAIAEEVPVSRPGSVRDLLERPDETLPAPEPLPSGTPEATAQPAPTAAPRAYDLKEDPAAMKRVDAKILEIAQANARRDIEVARRLVRPSPDRILPEGAAPVLRTPRAPEAPLGLPDTSLTRSLLADAPTGPSLPAQPGGPAMQAMAPGQDPVTAAPALPTLPVERELARKPAELEVAAAREEHDYQFLDDLVDIKLETYEAKGEAQGYFRLRILPRADRKLDPLPKDVTFVVDASQSIPQHKLNATAKGVADAVRRLHPQDQFNIVAFRDSPNLFRDAKVEASKANIEAAATFLRGLESRGATDFYRALTPVLAVAPRPGVPGVVLVISDGRPTTGLRDSRAIINAATAENRLGNAIFGFGGGNTVNQYLLDLLAYQNRGAAKVVANVADMTAGVPAFFAQLDDPLLVNLKTDFGRIDTREVFPRALPDFFRGRPITLYGRFDAAAPEEFTMRLTGAAEARKKELLFRANLKEAATGDAEIAREWAFAKCYAIIGEIAVDGETPARMDALNALSARYNIHTSYSE